MWKNYNRFLINLMLTLTKNTYFLKFEIAVAFGKAGTLWLDCVIYSLLSDRITVSLQHYLETPNGK